MENIELIKELRSVMIDRLNDFQLSDHLMHLKNCRRIVELFETHGFFISVEQAYAIWSDRSSNWCASWICYVDEYDDNSLWVDICKEGIFYNDLYENIPDEIYLSINNTEETEEPSLFDICAMIIQLAEEADDPLIFTETFSSTAAQIKGETLRLRYKDKAVEMLVAGQRPKNPLTDKDLDDIQHRIDTNI